jgi:hypothetical protein
VDDASGAEVGIREIFLSVGFRPSPDIGDSCSKAAFLRPEFFIPVIQPARLGSAIARLLSRR